MGCLSMFGGVCGLRLPETLHQRMPQTLEDGEEFGKDWTCEDFVRCIPLKWVVTCQHKIHIINGTHVSCPEDQRPITGARMKTWTATVMLTKTVVVTNTKWTILPTVQWIRKTEVDHRRSERRWRSNVRDVSRCVDWWGRIARWTRKSHRTEPSSWRTGFEKEE